MEATLQYGGRTFHITCNWDAQYPMWVAHIAEQRPGRATVVWTDVAIRRVEHHHALGAAVASISQAVTSPPVVERRPLPAPAVAAALIA